MKKMLCTAIIFAMIGTTVFAQEAGTTVPTEEGGEPQVQTGQQPSSNGQVALGWGTLSINGMFLTGVRTRMQNQEGWAKDGNWSLEGFNPVWEENRVDLYLNYSLSNFGAFLGIRAQSYSPNTFAYYEASPRYAFVYANFGPAKLSVGKLYDELLPVQGSKVWKSEGPGDAHRFTDEDNYSIRLEIEPIEGLNVGAQLFFINADGRDTFSGYYAEGIEDSDAWKEIGLGASYTSSLFNAQAGVRFDSNVDHFNSLDTGPSGGGSYLHHYYGMASMFAGSVPASVVSILGGDGLVIPKYKHMDKIVDTTASAYLPYDGGTYAFFGFNFKGVENLTATAHGGLYNLGAFDEFGYGRFAEFIKYNITPKLGAGITLQQEFYGSDVWPDDKVNSPFLQFGPQVSYAFITIPQMPMPLFAGTLDTSFGICPDVLDIYVKIKPTLSLSLGSFMADLFYEVEFTGYKESTNIKPLIRHTVGLALMVVF
jgi:hypothetical protein